MARRANGIDLSEAFIIVDSTAIKNTLCVQIIYLAPGLRGFYILRDDKPAC